MNNIRHLVVAIPAHNEEALLAGCLDSVNVAVNTLRAVQTHLSVRIVVALNNCTDGSAAVALAHGADIVDIDSPGVGPARDAAITYGLRRIAQYEDERVWLACTDADTVVSSTWLSRQLIWANSGMDLVVGTVEPIDVSDPNILASWHSQHCLTEGHPYVHGANLGIRASTWRAVAGFGALATAEDVALVARARSSTPRWVATDTTRVATSGRLIGRAERGFADYLTHLSVPQ